MAGGMTLIPTLKQRLAKPSDVVDLGKIAELKGIKNEGNAIVIGAMTRHVEVANSDVVKSAIPALAELAGHIGDPAVRNRGTIGGSIANNDPAADYPAAVAGARRDDHHQQAQDRGRRFLQGHVRDRARAGRDHHRGELPDPGEGGLHEIPEPGLALCDRRRVRGEDRQRRARRASPAPAPCVFRQKDMEAALAKSFTPDAIKDIKQKPDGLNSDIHASAEYRAHLVSVMARRAVTARSTA